MTYAIVFGANSYEHEISIVSAIVLNAKIKDEKVFIFCSSDREFYLIDKNDMKSSYFLNKSYLKSKKLILKQGGFYTEKSMFKNEMKIKFDVAINIIHGRDGEDGKIASLFDFYGIKYIGPRVEASVLSFDKELTKLHAKNVGVKTLDYECVKQNDDIKMPLPFILKPAKLGSSIGISIVKEQKDIGYAKDIAFEYDEKVLVEPFVANVKEYNLAGFYDGENMRFSIIEEPKKDDFLDFEQKYLAYNSNKVEEANLSDEVKKKMKDAFAKIYLPLFEGALIRCDFFVINDEIYLNEINPNPGSLANYLFDDFQNELDLLAKTIKNEKLIKIDYSYLKKLGQNSGKMQ